MSFDFVPDSEESSTIFGRGARTREESVHVEISHETVCDGQTEPH